MNTESNKLKPSIGFIGMGHMGSHMVQRLLDAGYQVTVYDRTKEKAQELEHRGALVVQTPKELAANCQVVMACVTNDEAQQEVMFGPDGALAGVHAGSVIIDLSTVSPDASRRLFQAAKEQGVSMIDAAVSGSVPQVDQGSLVIFVGGEHQTYQQCKPILDVLGHNSFFMGASGMGTTMKLVVNTLLGLSMQALAEAIALGEKAGVEKGLLLDVLGQTAVLTPGQKSKLDNVKREQYPTNFALSLMHKDFSLVLSQAYDVSVSMPATAAAQQMYAAAMAKGMDADFSIMIQFMEELAGLSTSSEELRRK
ncbi:MAG TPA: NAD(P)-dependent oxidoreductase [Ktedonobacter sp.]|jgi:3-hydroxyisobutyrate dehydrogenase-like beta-hydroxyacid dehydrogenase|nr:NAD(P)-dependent oxidoreductase [Ktedonobacter sp.]